MANVNSQTGNTLVELTGSNFEQAPGGAIPAKAVLMGISDGTNICAMQGNADGTLLASAARTAETISPNQINYNARGVVLYLSVTANPGGAESLSLVVAGRNQSGQAFYLAAAPNIITAANGVRALIFYPGAVETIVNSEVEVQGLPLPRSWAAVVLHSGSGSWTYSLDYSYIL